jgi:hypothetical protein
MVFSDEDLPYWGVVWNMILVMKMV